MLTPNQFHRQLRKAEKLQDELGNIRAYLVDEMRTILKKDSRFNAVIVRIDFRFGIYFDLILVIPPNVNADIPEFFRLNSDDNVKRALTDNLAKMFQIGILERSDTTPLGEAVYMVMLKRKHKGEK